MLLSFPIVCLLYTLSRLYATRLGCTFTTIRIPRIKLMDMQRYLSKSTNCCSCARGVAILYVVVDLKRSRRASQTWPSDGVLWYRWCTIRAWSRHRLSLETFLDHLTSALEVSSVNNHHIYNTLTMQSGISGETPLPEQHTMCKH